MKKYLQFKTEVGGLVDVSETIKAVEKIAASQVHFLKEKVADLEAYGDSIKKMMARLLLFYEDTGVENQLLLKGRTGKKAMIVISSDKGLVGGLFHNLTNLVVEKREKYDSFNVIGKRDWQYLEEEKVIVDKLFTDFSEVPQADEVQKVSNYFLEQFLKGRISKADIAYSKFISLGQQQPTVVSFLPFDFKLDKMTAADNGFGFPIFDSPRIDIFDDLLKRFIFTFIYKIIMEARLSEFSARTVAMEGASSKVYKIIKKVRSGYFKERKRNITQRQLEIFNVHQML